MSHILKKVGIAGAGGGGRPKPPIYRPPQLGQLQYGASFSYSETLDLISDGPIEGLVNKDGNIVKGLKILQGIYLDDTAVAVSDNDNIAQATSEIDQLTAELGAMPLTSTSAPTFCKKYFLELQNASTRSAAGRITALQSSAEDGSIIASEITELPNVNLVYIQTRNNHRVNQTEIIQGEGTYYPRKADRYALFIRAYLKYRQSLGAETFEFFLDGSRVTGLSDTNAAYRNTHKLKTNTRACFWTDNTTLANSKFFFGVNVNAFDPNTWAWGRGNFGPGWWGNAPGWATTSNNIRNNDNGINVFPDTHLFANEFAKEELEAIKALYDEANGLTSPNIYQKTVAEQALARLGWIEGSSIADLLKNFLGPAELGPIIPTWDDPFDISEGDGPAWNIQGGGNMLQENTQVGFVILKVENTGNSNLDDNSIVDDGNVINMQSILVGGVNGYNLQSLLSRNPAFMDYVDVSCPEVDTDGKMNGKMRGFVIIKFRIDKEQERVRFDTNFDGTVNERDSYAPHGMTHTFNVDGNLINLLSDISTLTYTSVADMEEVETQVEDDSSTVNSFPITNLKYNYSNVMAEFRRGEENQSPFNFFKSVYIDHIYNRPLFGPFGTKKATTNTTLNAQVNAPQRIFPNPLMLTRSQVLDPVGSAGSSNGKNFNLDIGEDSLPVNEGSDDERYTGSDEGYRNYSDWGKDSFAHWDEQAIPVVHTVYNPNVKSVFITLDVTSLRDTLIKDVEGVDFAEDTLKVGTTFPTVVNFRVETGKIGKNSDGTEGQEIPYRTYDFKIVALIEGNTLIDIGNPELDPNTAREFITPLSSVNQTSTVNTPFELPPTKITQQEVLSADGERGIEAGTIEEDSTQKRYIKVTKLSYETNSVLLSKDISVNKVTEIIDCNLTYPFASIIATKLDSRSFSSIPRRSFDCKLKKVKVPSNYFPEKVNGKDKRYYQTQGEFDDAPKEDKLVYKGDWNGEFHDTVKWTDNPAWILYDLLTNNRYGMGSHIDPTTINKWQLYKIGRFCDAVDSNGYFEGVTDGRGGKEPRFSCNIVFDQGQKIFDAINTISSLFRGRTFFNSSEINFVDDRPRNPVNLFTNESVKDGLFYYSNNQRDQQFNTIEIGFRDRFDNFSPKIEVIEDEADIMQRGVFKKRIEGIGITSRSMARRVGQHQIYSNIKENQNVAFTAGLETLLCRPGDLVIVEDELKTNHANFGKILNVDLDEEQIRVSNKFITDDFDGKLTIYNPTGIDTIADIGNIATRNRERYYSFEVTGLGTNAWSSYTGEYGFSGYTEGYSDAVGGIEGQSKFQQYAMYTGAIRTAASYFASGNLLYFETGVTGWVFGSGNAIELYSGDLISKLTGDQSLTAFNTGTITEIDMTEASKRATAGAKNHYPFSGIDESTLLVGTRGVLESEVSGVTPEQITVLNVTGEITNKSYGCLISGFDRPELLPFVKLGSPTKFEIKNASEFVYKVTSMKEEAANEYLVTATKYDTGKFNLIENHVSVEDKPNTYSYKVSQSVNGVTYSTLDTPEIKSLNTGVPNAVDNTLSITGMWTAVDNNTGYNARLTLPNGSLISSGNGQYVTGIEFTGLNQVGVYTLEVCALGDNVAAGGSTASYFDSQYDSSGIFVLYDELDAFTKSFVNNIHVL